MEAANATSPIPNDGSLRVYVNLYYVTGSFGLLGLLALLVFIVEAERVDARYSPFNISLMSYIVSLMALLILDGRTYEIMIGCHLSGSDYNFDRTALLNNVLKYIFTATMESSYLYYSWKRAGPILDAVFPNTEKIISRTILAWSLLGSLWHEIRPLERRKAEAK
ncbi:hypothetical protein BCR33DRAFT_723078 [Rhizoclosmatium globosum]|uniref:Uncharacterized protein n=1 Tax=Rhizoclosmatium globosum TaxID=329046 RepID=A0A1Y2BGC6_9FUNG|nr:hypothetical protein BCR33DRAFT_723078 [Rhizoclosmatium globosum]|eukprot:ORY33871.1 hypothetical protein BCR33DRAFT_723078 [Rhizoclosmatium globosum]